MNTERSTFGWPKDKEFAQFLFGDSAWYCKACNAYHGAERNKADMQQDLFKAKADVMAMEKTLQP